MSPAKERAMAAVVLSLFDKVKSSSDETTRWLLQACDTAMNYRCQVDARRFVPIIPTLVVSDGACLIGTGHGAIGAADADIVVLHHEAVGTLRGGARRAHRHAR